MAILDNQNQNQMEATVPIKVPFSKEEGEDKGRLVPKFGEWDVNDPSSAEGFTVIFNKEKLGFALYNPLAQKKWSRLRLANDVLSISKIRTASTRLELV
ncbi:unnamed protein product [Brassica oleracea]|uniref:RIN4 pathogenic type III effector avirulence factor Avr cleavage site domain-containing protein n=1 Tax=Brassica oleracea TaxID=3712 RepID=A0A3P6EKI6_BRAOL|nr:unnamed protein product [Brassica oleracea]